MGGMPIVRSCRKRVARRMPDQLVAVGGDAVPLLEVVARGERERVLRQRQPAARPLGAAKRDLVGAVGGDVELRVVDHARGAPAEPSVDSRLDGDRRVDRARQVPAHAVGELPRDRRVVIDRVRIVAGELARGRHDAPEGRPLGRALELERESALEDVHHRARRLGHVGGARQIPFGGEEARVHLLELRDQLAQRAPGFAGDLGHVFLSPARCAC
jgi:hypothetical protein